MIRREAFAGVGGFDDTVAAGEEPELCQRLSRQGWRLLRLDCAMAWHDLAMSRFGQWWRRQVRGGYGGLDVARRFGLARFRRNNWRARFWSTWPLLVVAAGLGMGHWGGMAYGVLVALPVFALWPLQMARIAMRTWRQGQPLPVALAYAFFTLVAFWPQMLGQIRYVLDRQQGRGYPRLIEYKAVPPAARLTGRPDATPTEAGLR